jgi:hypothetical protein
MSEAQARYRANHPDRAAATLADVEARTIKRPSVRFMRGRDDDLYDWMKKRYGAVGGPEILAALDDLKSLTQPPSPHAP